MSIENQIEEVLKKKYDLRNLTSMDRGQIALAIKQFILDCKPKDKVTPTGNCFDSADHEVPVEVEAYNKGHNGGINTWQDNLQNGKRGKG